MSELWERAMRAREAERAQRRGQGAAARLALVDVLRKAGVQVSLVTVHRWPRERQGEAYLWAIAFLNGREDLPMPGFLVDGPRVAMGLAARPVAKAAPIPPDVPNARKANRR
jgi:hypothetical protein